MSYHNPTSSVQDYKRGDRVAYVDFDGGRERGTVTSVNQLYVFVSFDKDMVGSSKACDPRDLEKEWSV